MKKVLFIQNHASTKGGVWSVNKALIDELNNSGYDARIIAIRETFKKEDTKGIKAYSVEENKSWEVPFRSDVKKYLFKFEIKKAVKALKEIIDRKHDIKRLFTFINSFKPDYIVATHYQVLDGIPKNYLNKTISIHHNSFKVYNENKSHVKTYQRYNNKVYFAFLSKATCKKAKQSGLNNCHYLYNPVKFNTDLVAPVLDNKKIIIVSRLSREKRIDLMIDIVKDVFKNKKLKDWTMHIYGDGSETLKLVKKIENENRIFIHDRTDNAKETFLSGSITLNTSLYEGFPMNILEASECGVPTITFDFGESCKEEVITNKTGFIIPFDDLKKFKEKLILLMSSKRLLKKMSRECKEYNKKFNVKNSLAMYLKLFKEIDKGVIR